MRYVFLGIQGSGKGTQARLLSQRLGFAHINTGELFREHIFQRTTIGLEAEGYIEKGRLVTDNVVFKVIEEALSHPANGFVFDGFPRTLRQAEFLTHNYPAKKVFYLELADDIATARMLARRCCCRCSADYNLLFKLPIIDGICDKCGGDLVKRDDDTPELIASRIELFHQETKPLRDYYQNRGILETVSAAGDIDQIHESIMNSL